MNSLKIGDKIIYPNQGLGVIESIHEEAYDGERFMVFHLRIISNNTLVTVPSSTALELGIRRPVTEGSIRKIFHFMEKAKELMVPEISEAAASPSSKVEEKLLGTLSRCFKTAKSRIAA